MSTWYFFRTSGILLNCVWPHRLRRCFFLLALLVLYDNEADLAVSTVPKKSPESSAAAREELCANKPSKLAGIYGMFFSRRWRVYARVSPASEAHPSPAPARIGILISRPVPASHRRSSPSFNRQGLNVCLHPVSSSLVMKCSPAAAAPINHRP